MTGSTRSDGDGEQAQMLLLTAIILAIGFIALSSIAARVEQIPEEAITSQQGQFFDEVNLVSDGVTLAMDGLAEDHAYTDLGDSGFADELAAMLAHLSQVERGHGYLVSIGAVQCTTPSDVELSVDVAIASAEQDVTITLVRSYSSASC